MTLKILEFFQNIQNQWKLLVMNEFRPLRMKETKMGNFVHRLQAKLHKLSYELS
jgi:hypothetical protein